MVWFRLLGGLNEKSLVSVCCRGEKRSFEFSTTLGQLQSANKDVRNVAEAVDFVDFVGHSLDTDSDVMTEERRMVVKNVLSKFISMFGIYKELLKH
jgi:hypothetical protein